MNHIAQELNKLFGSHFHEIEPAIRQHMMDSIISYDLNLMVDNLKGDNNAGHFTMLSTVYSFGLVAASVNILSRFIKAVESMHENNPQVSKQDCDEAVDVIVKHFWSFLCSNLNAKEHGSLGMRLSQISAEQMAKRMPTAEDVANAVATAFAKGEAASKKGNDNG